MTRDELMALRVRCPVCAGLLCVEGFLCRTCRGTGHVLPATDEVLAMVDAADFWRTVALKAAEATDYDYPMDWDAEQRLAAIADEVRTARRKAEEAGETLPPDPLPSDPVAAACAITSHDGAVAIPQALMLLSKEYGLATEQATELLVRAVEALAEHIEIACEGFAHGSMSAMEVAPGWYTDAAEIAAWARERARAREESGE